MKKHIFTKFVFTFASIVVLYTLLLVVTVFSQNKNISFMERNYKNEISTGKVATLLEDKINTGLIFLDNISQTPIVDDYANSIKTNYAYSTAIYNHLKYDYNNLNSPYFSIGVAKLTNDLVITPESTTDYNRFISDINIDPNKLPYLPSLFKNKLTSYFIVPKDMYMDESDNINIIRKVDYNSDSLYYFLTFYLEDFLNSMPLMDENGILFLLSNEVVYQSNDIYFNENDYVYELDKINGYEVSNFTINNTVNYAIQSTSLPNVKYLYSVDKKSMYSTVNDISKNIFILNLILLVLGISIVYVALKRTYKPITNILTLFGDEGVQICNDNSNFIDEFEFIRNSIINLNNSNEDLNNYNKTLQNTIDNSLGTLQENFLRKVLYGVLSHDVIKTSLNDVNLNILVDGGTLCVVDINGKSNLEAALSYKDIIALRSNVLSKFNENNDLFKTFIVPIDYKKYCILFTIKDVSVVEDTINNMISSIGKNSHLEITPYVSSPVANISDFNTAFLKVSNLLEYNSAVITKDDLENVNYSFSLEAESNIINYFTSQNIDKALQFLSDILDKNSQLDMYNTNNFKYVLLNTIRRILTEKDITLKQFYKNNEELFYEFNKCGNKDLKQCTVELFNKLFNDYFMDNNENIDNPLVSNILLYIQQNFHKDISLADVADPFNLSEGYVCKLLKDSANITFKNYVNTLKVKKAKELLSDGNYKVSEVSKIVGFENTSSFIRMFKKYESISPGEYVKLQSLTNINNSAENNC